MVAATKKELAGPATCAVLRRCSLPVRHTLTARSFSSYAHTNISMSVTASTDLPIDAEVKVCALSGVLVVRVSIAEQTALAPRARRQTAPSASSPRSSLSLFRCTLSVGRFLARVRRVERGCRAAPALSGRRRLLDGACRWPRRQRHRRRCRLRVQARVAPAGRLCLALAARAEPHHDWRVSAVPFMARRLRWPRCHCERRLPRAAARRAERAVRTRRGAARRGRGCGAGVGSSARLCATRIV